MAQAIKLIFLTELGVGKKLPMKISIIGTGYIGTVRAACFAELGHEVICVDVGKSKIDRINAGIQPIYEVGLSGLFVS